MHKAIIQSGGGRPGAIGGRKMGGGPVGGKHRRRVRQTDGHHRRRCRRACRSLRALSAEDVAKGLNMASMGVPTYVGGPVEDGTTVIGAATQLYAAGKGARCR